jgi:hypothetical protein
VFVTDRRARIALPPGDLDPATGRARLSYRRAAELFEQATVAVPVDHGRCTSFGTRRSPRPPRSAPTPPPCLPNRPLLGGVAGPLRRVSRSAGPPTATRPSPTTALILAATLRLGPRSQATGPTRSAPDQQSHPGVCFERANRLLLGCDVLGWWDLRCRLVGGGVLDLRTAGWSRVASPGTCPRRSWSSATMAWSSVVWAGRSISTVRAATAGPIPLSPHFRREPT